MNESICMRRASCTFLIQNPRSNFLSTLSLPYIHTGEEWYLPTAVGLCVCAIKCALNMKRAFVAEIYESLCIMKKGSLYLRHFAENFVVLWGDWTKYYAFCVINFQIFRRKLFKKHEKFAASFHIKYDYYSTTFEHKHSFIYYQNDEARGIRKFAWIVN
jgi:hypothetical protein